MVISIIEALRAAIAHEEQQYAARVRQADVHDNSDGVGQSYDYTSATPMPSWVKDAKAALAEMTWQPIDTAPRDGKRPLLIAEFSKGGELARLDWGAGWEHDPGMNSPNGYEPPSSYWASACGRVEEPTHWMYEPDWFATLLPKAR